MLKKIIASLLAFFSGFAFVRFFQIRRGDSRLAELNSELEASEGESIEQAEVEKEIALEQLREISQHIESADMGELVELINDTFGKQND